MASILRTTGRVSGFGDPSLISFWWRPGTAGGSTADATDCLARFRSLWNGLGPKLANGALVTFDGLCVVLDDTTGTLTGAFAGTIPASVSGAGGSSPLPLQTQGLIRWTGTGVVAGRRVQGRTFVPYPDEADNVAPGVPGSSYVSQLATGITNLLTVGTTASAPVTWHRPGPAGAGASFVVTGGTGVGTWAVLRSRRT
jgi:hypothetical protein